MSQTGYGRVDGLHGRRLSVPIGDRLAVIDLLNFGSTGAAVLGRVVVLAGGRSVEGSVAGARGTVDRGGLAAGSLGIRSGPPVFGTAHQRRLYGHDDCTSSAVAPHRDGDWCQRAPGGDGTRSDSEAH